MRDRKEGEWRRKVSFKTRATPPRHCEANLWRKPAAGGVGGVNAALGILLVMKN